MKTKRLLFLIVCLSVAFVSNGQQDLLDDGGCSPSMQVLRS